MTQPSPESPSPRDPVTPFPLVTSKELFGDHKELHISHQGETYRLRITSRGKLILQK